MKRGCFISAVVLFTLIVGTVVYFVKYKKDIFKNFSKDKIIDVAEFDKKLNDVKASVYRDSMKIAVHNFLDESKKYNFDSAITRLQDVMDEARFLYHDGIVDSADFNHIKQIINSYERSEKNRN
jgi:hypothetical protein